MQKFLLILFVFLLMIVAAEIIILVLPKKQLAPFTLSITPSPAVIIKATPTPANTIATTAEMAINGQTWDGFRQIHKGMLVSSMATNEFRGRIAELNYGGGTEQTFNYAFRIRLYADNGVTNAFLFSAKELGNIRATQIVNGQELPYELKNLKIGDYVSLYLTVNLMQDPDNSFISGKIVKLR